MSRFSAYACTTRSRYNSSQANITAGRIMSTKLDEDGASDRNALAENLQSLGKRHGRSSVLLAVVLLGGCSSIPGDLGRSEVNELVVAHGQTVEEHTDELLERLTSAPLSADSAIRIALINNPELQASYASLGFAAADVYDAGRIGNPVLSAAFLDTNAAGERDHVEGDGFDEVGALGEVDGAAVVGELGGPVAHLADLLVELFDARQPGARGGLVGADDHALEAGLDGERLVNSPDQRYTIRVFRFGGGTSFYHSVTSLGTDRFSFGIRPNDWQFRSIDEAREFLEDRLGLESLE